MLPDSSKTLGSSIVDWTLISGFSLFRDIKIKEDNMKPENMRTIHRVINVFGEQNQKMQTLEELMELQSALFENIHRREY